MMKPKRWTSVRREAQIEFEEKRSRFIGICLPLKDTAEAEARLARCRADYPDATHHVYAWQLVLPELGGRYSDDGEPHGTAGMPVRDVLGRGGIDQAQILVVRYFGGTLLGTGGLVHAYSKAASLALEAAEPLAFEERQRLHVMIPYPCLERFRYQCNAEGFVEVEASFGMDAELIISCPPKQEERLYELAAQLSSGQAIVENIGAAYSEVPFRS